MYQPPEPAAYIPAPTRFSIRHGLPEYTFQETPLALSSRRAGSGGGGGAGGVHAGGGSISGGSGSGYGSGGLGLGSAGTVGADNIDSGAGAGTFYTTPLYSGNTGALGPAPGILSSFPFHYNNEFHHNHNTTSTRSRIKMELNPDDITAQEAAAIEYQSRTMVRMHHLSFMLIKRMRMRTREDKHSISPPSPSSCSLTSNHRHYSRESSGHVIPMLSNFTTNIQTCEVQQSSPSRSSSP